ncbi:MAG: hypothetical protein LBE81_09595 [Azonexus sp.]|jgi:hypothetical protein|uniref:hypothetical protein n=1 Tax=Azonexus sp. TaxID=1872668 RepID=UPI00281DCCB0|nr:hypothetical protein [Azonexus sp.]MDR0776873.1 hypothetical protein [Azonexus sp.]
MPRQNTRLESEGAEFLVLGNLLIRGIAAYKSYTNTAGYDLLAVQPETNCAARIQVKSRWRTGAEGFIINNFSCDFVVVVLLNRGTKTGTGEVRPPAFHIFPVSEIEGLQRSGWGKLALTKIPGFCEAENRWGIISEFLARSEGANPSFNPDALKCAGQFRR